jgi:hypothetical protein
MDDSSRDLLDQDALDRIVVATGFPLCTDQESLEADLVQCYRRWCLLSDFGRSAAKKGIERLTRLVGWATEGAKLLSADEDDQGHVRELWASHGGAYPPLLPQIKLVEALLKQVSLDAVDYKGSPLENLTGVLLPNVFQHHFRRPPKLSRDQNTNELGGPYIRFAQQVCIECEIKCRPETIASAMRRRHRAKPRDK